MPVRLIKHAYVPPIASHEPERTRHPHPTKDQGAEFDGVEAGHLRPQASGLRRSQASRVCEVCPVVPTVVVDASVIACRCPYAFNFVPAEADD